MQLDHWTAVIGGIASAISGVLWLIAKMWYRAQDLRREAMVEDAKAQRETKVEDAKARAEIAESDAVAAEADAREAKAEAEAAKTRGSVPQIVITEKKP